ncbi:hypothetical protein BV898_07428 [Hypsibius exemplaris]|uniref:Uncharacterized protein n=1 Tax=Hypsibius exemplaris TaxID=2072580 RepID=A0A1W0WTS2_HYPEX|nr:hypothetical protein BV898_07428 [Hypsibius exemplaris]
MSTGTASHDSDSDYEDDVGNVPSRQPGNDLPQPCVSPSISPSIGRNPDSSKFIQASSRDERPPLTPLKTNITLPVQRTEQKISSHSFAKLLAGLDVDKCHSVVERILNRPVMKAFVADSHFTEEAIPLACGLSLADFWTIERNPLAELLPRRRELQRGVLTTVMPYMLHERTYSAIATLSVKEFLHMDDERYSYFKTMAQTNFALDGSSAKSPDWSVEPVGRNVLINDGSSRPTYVVEVAVSEPLKKLRDDTRQAVENETGVNIALSVKVDDDHNTGTIIYRERTILMGDMTSRRPSYEINFRLDDVDRTDYNSVGRSWPEAFRMPRDQLFQGVDAARRPPGHLTFMMDLRRVAEVIATVLADVRLRPLEVGSPSTHTDGDITLYNVNSPGSAESVQDILIRSTVKAKQWEANLARQRTEQKISSHSFAKLLAGLDVDKCHSVVERILNRPVMKAFVADSHFTEEAIPLACGLSLADFWTIERNPLAELLPRRRELQRGVLTSVMPFAFHETTLSAVVTLSVKEFLHMDDERYSYFIPMAQTNFALDGNSTKSPDWSVQPVGRERFLDDGSSRPTYVVEIAVSEPLKKLRDDARRAVENEIGVNVALSVKVDDDHNTGTVIYRERTIRRGGMISRRPSYDISFRLDDVDRTDYNSVGRSWPEAFRMPRDQLFQGVDVARHPPDHLTFMMDLRRVAEVTAAAVSLVRSQPPPVRSPRLDTPTHIAGDITLYNDDSPGSAESVQNILTRSTVKARQWEANLARQSLGALGRLQTDYESASDDVDVEPDSSTGLPLQPKRKLNFDEGDGDASKEDEHVGSNERSNLPSRSSPFDTVELGRLSQPDSDDEGHSCRGELFGLTLPSCVHQPAVTTPLTGRLRFRKHIKTADHRVNLEKSHGNKRQCENRKLLSDSEVSCGRDADDQTITDMDPMEGDALEAAVICAKSFPEDDWDDDLHSLADTGDPGIPVRAMYDYEALEEDELTFNRGDYLRNWKTRTTKAGEKRPSARAGWSLSGIIRERCSWTLKRVEPQ